ncbi:butyrophilin subfamily 1 member A1 [Salminus brasiliensis]|uniref:butyrophilin subfamily 1 member A1 n=1 Tax=Salminus brasiliensis TaxID=930266 RepID=UPI003B835EE6
MLACVLVVLLCSTLAHGSDSFTINVADSVVGRLGSSVILPCWVSPPMDVGDMEIRWYRPHKFNTPVLFNSKKTLVTDLEEESYRNRTSLALRDAHSTGLKVGDVSLRLENLNIDDEGIFHCYVSGEKAYNSNHITLNITVLGSSPVLSLKPQDGQVNVSCRSCGWHPQPTVKWMSDRNTILRSRGLVYSRQTDRLACVHSWVLVSPSDTNRVSCSLSISEEEERDSIVDIQNVAQLTDKGTGPWKALFALAVLAALAMIIFSVVLYKKYKTGYMLANKDEKAPHADMDELRKDAENLTLDRLKCPTDVIINSEGKVIRDKTKTNHKGLGFPYSLSIPAINSFTSGRAYWEVDLAAHNVQPKQSWLIGVTKASNYLTNNKADLLPSKGFWFLCSDGQNGVHVNTEPEILLPLHPRPETVGVLLDYDKGELSFYNAKESVHLFTMKTKFQGEIVPLFNPGLGDKAPLTIITIKSTQSNSPREPACV